MKLFKLIETSFDNFDNTINSYLNKALSSLGIQYGNSQLFKVILEGIKGVIQNAMIYIEDAFTEQNIETAIRKKSIYSLAKISGYEAYYGTAATGIVVASLISNTNLSMDVKKIYIENFTNIRNDISGLNYILYLQSDRYVFDVSKPLTNYEFRIIQGFYNRMTYVSNGEPLMTVHMNINGMFDRNFIKVFVNNIEWQQVSNLYDMTEDGEEYVVSIGFDNEIDIMFGNGVFGKIPPKDSNIIITYIKHNGELGNITDLMTAKLYFVGKGYDYNGNPIDLNNYIKISINNYITGGTNSDTISDVRRMVGYNSRSNVLASIDNYRLFLKHFSFIGNFNIWSEPNSNTLCINAINNKLSSLTPDDTVKDSDLLLSETQKEQIITVLKNSNSTFAGISIKFVDPIIYKYAILCYVKIDELYYKEVIEENIKQTIFSYFISKNFNVDFISKSDIMKNILDNVDHIKSINMTIISDMNEKAYKNTYYYKYSSANENGKIVYKMNKYNYETNLNLGLDEMNNIYLDNSIYMPLLQDGIKYYQDKSKNPLLNNDSITLKAINIIFI